MNEKVKANESLSPNAWAIIFCIVAFVSLGSEMFTAWLDGAAAFGSYYTRGFNLIEFSPLGFIPMLAPLILILLLYAELPYVTTIKSLFVVSIINVISFNHALIALHSEMVGPIKWVVHLEWGIPVYMIAITIAEIAVFLSLKSKKQEEEK